MRPNKDFQSTIGSILPNCALRSIRHKPPCLNPGAFPGKDTPMIPKELLDPLPLAQDLSRCNSVTPADGGSQAVLARALESLGFTVTHLRYGDIDNLFARIGTGGRHLCFAGHTDVVPVGASNWRADPFGGEVRDGVLYGRGACDMKGAIAAFVAGIAQHIAETPLTGSISFLITGDEEGPAIDGTV